MPPRAIKIPDSITKKKGPSLMQTLGQNNIDTNNVQDIPLDKIVLPEYQSRRYIPTKKIQEYAESIRVEGVNIPILVSPLDNGNYELVYGQTRYKASLIAEKDTIPSIVSKLSREEQIKISVIENLKRNDLAPVDEVDAILHLIKLKFNCDELAAIGMVKEAYYVVRGRKPESNYTESYCDNVIAALDQWNGSRQEELEYCYRLIAEIIETTSNNTLDGFTANKLPLLNLPSMILEKVREGLLEYTKAKAIAIPRITDEDFRESLLKEAIEETLSIREIRRRIDEKYPREKKNEVRQRWAKASKLLDKSDVWGDEAKEKKIAQLLNELEKLMQ